MLELRIENLENQVAKLTIAIEKLTEVLTTNTTPPTVVVQADAVPVEEQMPEELRATSKKMADVEDVRAALISLSKTNGKEVARRLLADFKATKVGDLKKPDYAKVVDAAARYREAA